MIKKWLKYSEIFQYHVYSGGLWFRFRGKGVSITNRLKHPPLFSERIGKTKGFSFLNWRINFLA